MATDLRNHYRNLVDEYKTLFGELAAVQGEEATARKLAWDQSQQTSATGTAYEGDMLTTDLRIDIIELRGKLMALEAELTWVRDMLTTGVTTWEF